LHSGCAIDFASFLRFFAFGSSKLFSGGRSLLSPAFDAQHRMRRLACERKLCVDDAGNWILTCTIVARFINHHDTSSLVFVVVIVVFILV
jgi:hypothetical protein